MVAIPFENVPKAPADLFAATKPVKSGEDDAGLSFEDHLRPPSDDDRPAAATVDPTDSDRADDPPEQKTDEAQPTSEHNDTDDEPKANETTDNKNDQNEDEKPAEDVVEVAAVNEVLEISSQVLSTEVNVESAEVIVDEVAIEVEKLAVEAVATKQATDAESKVAVDLELENAVEQVDTKTTETKQVDVKLDVDAEAKTDQAKSTDEQVQVQQTATVDTETSDEEAKRDGRQSTDVEQKVTEVKEKTAIEATDSSDDADGRRVKKKSKTDVKIEPVGNQGPAESNETSTSNAGRVPRHLAARGAGPNGQQIELSEADQGRFVQRVARAFEAARGQRGQIRLRLSPPELGSLRLEVRMQGGAMTARIEAETNVARSLLVDNLGALRERLEQQGIRMERFEVDVPDRGQSDLPDSQEDRQRDEPDASTESHTSGDTNTEDQSTRTTTRTSLPGDDQLNVLI